MTPTTPRDPRVDPQRGDVLVTAFRTRRVIERRWDTAEPTVDYSCPNGSWARVTIRAWRTWAKKARVEKVGDAE